MPRAGRSLSDGATAYCLDAVHVLLPVELQTCPLEPAVCVVCMEPLAAVVDVNAPEIAVPLEEELNLPAEIATGTNDVEVIPLNPQSPVTLIPIDRSITLDPDTENVTVLPSDVEPRHAPLVGATELGPVEVPPPQPAT